MNQIRKHVGCAAISLIAFGSPGAAWADCWLPNFSGGYQAYITSYTAIPSAGLAWASCRIVITDAGVIGNATCTTSLGVNANLTNASLKVVSSAACQFSATFTVAVPSVATGTYTARSITLADDHLTAKGVGTFVQSRKTTAFVVDMVRLN